MGLNSERAILERTLTRGEFVLRRFKCSAVTLGVFTDKLPNSRGLARAQIDQDLKDGRAIQKALGVGSTAGKAAPHTGASRGRGAYGTSAPHGYSTLAGYTAQRAPPAGFAPLAAGVGRGGAAAAQSVVLPLPSAVGGDSKEEARQGKAGRRQRRPWQCPAPTSVESCSVGHRQVQLRMSSSSSNRFRPVPRATNAPLPEETPITTTGSVHLSVAPVAGAGGIGDPPARINMGANRSHGMVALHVE